MIDVNDMYDALTGICNIFASMSRVLVYKTRLSSSSLSPSIDELIGLCRDFSSWPIFLNTLHALVSLSDCFRFTVIRLKHERTHRDRTHEAFHVNCTPSGGCKSAMIEMPVRHIKFIIRKDTPTAWSLLR